jgi:hypothetical protein
MTRSAGSSVVCNGPEDFEQMSTRPIKFIKPPGAEKLALTPASCLFRPPTPELPGWHQHLGRPCRNFGRRCA